MHKTLIAVPSKMLGRTGSTLTRVYRTCFVAAAIAMVTASNAFAAAGDLETDGLALVNTMEDKVKPFLLAALTIVALFVLAKVVKRAMNKAGG